MTESEAIKRLDRNAYRTTCYGNRVVEHEENLIAIQALEKQEKIKDLLDSCTAYPDDMCDCLVEIEKILRSDEE